MSSGKSPYELRTELLSLAASILTEQHRARHARALAEAAKGAKGPINDPGPLTAPTTEDVIEEAEKFNQFIQKR